MVSGERSGQINIPKEHDEHGEATLAFGYGLSVTPLQLTQADLWWRER